MCVDVKYIITILHAKCRVHEQHRLVPGPIGPKDRLDGCYTRVLELELALLDVWDVVLAPVLLSRREQATICRPLAISRKLHAVHPAIGDQWSLSLLQM
jgi:hypothetical protein